jgi:hypothetical protein
MKSPIALCCVILSLPVFAASTHEAMDFPDESNYPPVEGELELPEQELYGYSDGFFIQNSDNTFSLVFNGMVQARYTYSSVSELSDDQQFALRRTKFFFSGHFIDESWTYVLGTLAGPDGVFAIDDAYIAKAFTPNTIGQVGQFNTPFLREFTISSSRQLAVERSLIAKYFSTLHTTGALFETEESWFKWQAVVSNGYFTPSYDENQDVIDREFQNGTTYALISRLELKPFGTWREFRDYNSPSGNEMGLLIGIAGAYQHDSGLIKGEDTSGTVDITLQGSGWSTFAMGAVNTDHINNETTYGAQVQGGVFVDENQDMFELFSRYEWGKGMQDQKLSLLTSGFNYYIDPKHLKLTTDFGYAFSSVEESWADETDGWRITDQTGQWVIRTQLQLVI